MSTLLPFGAKGSFVRQASNHKHLKEPAANKAAATTFMMTLLVPQPPSPVNTDFSVLVVIVHASQRLSHHPYTMISFTRTINRDPLMLGEPCLWGNTNVFLEDPGSEELPIYDSE